MDQFYQNIYSDLFYYWVIGKKADFHQHHILMSKVDNGDSARIIRFDLTNATAYLKIWKEDLVEEEIIDENGEHLFYLHYHINDIRQCRYLFYEFYKVILHHNNQIKIKVALCCSGGLSTSLFSIKLAELVDLEKLNYDLVAISIYHLRYQLNDFDAILLAPQIAYLEPAILKATDRKIPIFCIEPIDFATNNYHRVLTQLNQLQLSKLK